MGQKHRKRNNVAEDKPKFMFKKEELDREFRKVS
jgi:hypothetical protein